METLIFHIEGRGGLYLHLVEAFMFQLVWHDAFKLPGTQIPRCQPQESLTTVLELANDQWLRFAGIGRLHLPLDNDIPQGDTHLDLNTIAAALRSEHRSPAPKALRLLHTALLFTGHNDIHGLDIDTLYLTALDQLMCGRQDAAIILDLCDSINCPHPETHSETTGAYHLGPTGVWDDIATITTCCACGQEVP